MQKSEWFNKFHANGKALRELVAKFHPKSNQRSRADLEQAYPITAASAEAACETARKQIAEKNIDPLKGFDRAVLLKDNIALSRLLSETWFGMPESVNVRAEPGFYCLCDLLDDPIEEDQC